MSNIKSIQKRIKLLTNQLAIEHLKLEKAVADVLEPSVECCGGIYDSISEYDKHRNTKKCKLNRKEPHFRCMLCNKLFFDGEWSTDDLIADPIAYKKSSYRKHLNPFNNPHYCKSECDICDVQFDSLYMAQKHRNCKKPTSPAPVKRKASPAPVKRKFNIKRKIEPKIEIESDNSDSGSEMLEHLVYIKLHGYQYTHNTITDAIYDDLDEYQGQAIKDDMENIYDIDRDYDKPPEKKSYKII